MTTTSPLVSIVMCAYNTRQFIEQAVESICQQSFEDWELIISDDNSTDGTREWLARLEGHPKVRLFFQAENVGYVANKNFAISQASGEYITQNDSDDISKPDRLEKQLRVVSRNQGVKIVACGYERIDFQNNAYQSVHSERDILVRSFTGTYPFWFPPLLVHRDVYKQIGYYSPHFANAGDDLYWTVKANERYEIYCLRDVLYGYRDNPTSLTYDWRVLNDDRKLLDPAILNELIRQRRENGTDWLERGDLDSLRKFEHKLRSDRMFMAEQYRMWATRAVDKKNWLAAKELLRRAYRFYPWQIRNLSTSFYLLRAYYGK